jgi:proline iminopeptidase
MKLRFGQFLLAFLLPFTYHHFCAAPITAQLARQQITHPPGNFAVVDGSMLWHESEGQGEPLLLIAGGPGFSHSYFHPFFSALADSYRIIYFDAFGCGKSDRAKSTGGYSLARHVEEVEGLRKVLKLERINVLGHSYGGFVAQTYALKYPNSVKRLILANTIPSSKDMQAILDNLNQEFRNQMPEAWAKLKQIRARGIRSSAKEHQNAYTLPATLVNFYDPSNASKLPVGEPLLYNPDLWYAIAGEDADFVVGGELARYDVRAELKRLTMPVLVLAGRSDRNVFPRLSLQYKSLIPKAEFVMFEKSGHFPFVEEATEAVAVIGKFLAK